MLKAARNEIEAFEAAVAMHKRDQELQKRIKEAKIKESVIVQKLRELGHKV